MRNWLVSCRSAAVAGRVNGQQSVGRTSSSLVPLILHSLQYGIRGIRSCDKYEIQNQTFLSLFTVSSSAETMYLHYSSRTMKSVVCQKHCVASMTSHKNVRDFRTKTGSTKQTVALAAFRSGDSSQSRFAVRSCELKRVLMGRWEGSAWKRHRIRSDP